MKKRRPQRDTAFVNLILELAPGDKFVGCSFSSCAFVGLPGAAFDSCCFMDCDSGILNQKTATYHDCSFGFTASPDSDDA